MSVLARTGHNCVLMEIQFVRAFLCGVRIKFKERNEKTFYFFFWFRRQSGRNILLTILMVLGY